MNNLIDDFRDEKECIYNGEHYTVRDNGAVFRHQQSNSRIRKHDNIWTFGVKNKQGYLCIGNHRVHIIVATAFFGERNSNVFVVDHIDTNKCNNRINNLRWVTRLDNIVGNPITRAKVEYLCGGDITKFIENPSCLNELKNKAQDVSYMRPVSNKEAAAYMQHQNNRLAEIEKRKDIVSDRKCGFPDSMVWYKSSMSALNKNDKEWLYKEPIHKYIPPKDVFVRAEYPQTAWQMNGWKTPTRFLCCPLFATENGIHEYYQNLKKGTVFSCNTHGEYYVLDAAIIDEGKAIIVMLKTSDNIKPYALAKIMYSGRQFVHENVYTYFQRIGALHYGTRKRLVWARVF